MIYLLTFIILFFFVIWFDLQKHSHNKLYVYYYMVLVLTFISALSYRLGADTVVYMDEFEDYKSLFEADCQNFQLYDDRQLGWVFLLSVVKTIGGGFFILKLVCSVWINFVFAGFIRKYTKYIFTLLLLYYFAFYTNSNFEIMRESISVSFFLLSINAYMQRKWWKYYLFFIFAFLFHESSLFMLFIPLLSRLKIAENFIVYATIVVVIAFWNFDLNYLLSVILPFDISLFEKLSIYLYSETYGTSEYLSANWILVLVSCVIPSIVFYFLFKRNIRTQYAVFAILYTFICGLMYKMPIFSRFNNYLIFIILLLYADFFISFSKIIFNRYYKSLFIMFVLCYCMYKMNYYFGSSHCPDSVMIYSRYYPYDNIFMKELDMQREYGHRVNMNK